MSADDYSRAIFEAGQVLVAAGWASAKQILDLQTEFDVVPASAIAQLRGMVKQFTFMAVGRERDVLRAILEQGLDEGQSASDVAATIATAFADGYHVVDEAGNVVRTVATDNWSDMVARTELSRASNLGSMALYQSAGIAKVQWIASGGDNMCDECDAADGEIVDIGEDFPGVETDQPPAHPNCVCTTVPADEDIPDFTGDQPPAEMM
jgi:SPP1 gp7 family putative phage head morphogenesis protein